MIINIDLDENEIPLYESFFKIYEHQFSIFSDCGEKTFLGHNDKICRFCEKAFPAVKFSREAHVIPQSIGNRYLLSYFECDECNKLFSKFEDSFTNFLSYLRPFAGVVNQNNKKKRVQHKENKSGLEIHSNEGGVEFYIERKNKHILNIDYEKFQVALDVTIPPYIPLYVYKTLLKIALCCIPESEVKNFKKTFQFLQMDNINKELKEAGYFKIFFTTIPGEQNIYKEPFGLLYQKKEEFKEELNPSKIFCLFFANRVFQIFLPFNSEDNNLIGRKFEALRASIPIEKSYTKEYGSASRTIIDLSSEIQVKDSKEILKMAFLDGEFFPKNF